MRYLFYIAALFFAMGCVKEIEYKPTEKLGKIPVIHAFFSPDSLLESDVSLVRGILDDEVIVKDADLNLYINNVMFQKLNYVEKTKYKGGVNAMKPNDSFYLQVSGSLGPMQIYGKVPNRVVITSLDTSTILLPGKGKSFNFNLKFKDSAVHENFYRIYVRKISYQYIYDLNDVLVDSMIVADLLPIEGKETPFIRNNFNNYTTQEILFSDEIINGLNNNFNIFTTGNLKKGKFLRPIRLEFHLENVNKPLYDFYNTRNAHLWQQNSITQIPGLVQGNVPGGYGVVAAFTEQRISIKLP